MKAHQRSKRKSVKTHGDGLAMFGLMGVVLVIGGLLVWSANSRGTVGASQSTSPVTQTLPPATCTYCQGNLVRKTADEIGQYALQYALDNHVVRTGTPQILLSRGITREEYTALGLGCLPEFPVIEQPPLALVIMKGDFDLNSFPGSHAPIPQASKESIYLSYVFDLWVGKPTAWQTSKTGGAFRAALNDPSLPNDGNEPSGCPPQLPPSQITLHYGQAAPGYKAPSMPTEVRPYTPVPSTDITAVPPAISTETKK